MAFNLIIDPRVIQDVKDAIDNYDEQQPGLRSSFEAALNNHLITLGKMHCN